MDVVRMVNWVLSVRNPKDRTFVGVKLHFVFGFPLLEGVEVFLKSQSVGWISNGSIEEAVVSKEADFSARREILVYVIYVDEEEEGPQDCSLGDSTDDI